MELSTILSLIAAIIVSIGGGVGISHLINAKSNKKKIEADAHKTTAEAEHEEQEGRKDELDILRGIIETLQKQMERNQAQMVLMQEEIDALKTEIQRLANELRQKNACLLRAERFIRDSLARFDAVREEYFDRLNEWPLTTKPDGWEDYINDL